MSVVAVAVGGFVYLLINAEPGERASYSVSFSDCSPREETHLAAVHRVLVDNNRLLGQFEGRLAVGSDIDIRTDLQKPYPMQLTCVTSGECTHGVVPPGSIGLLSPSINLEVCDYTWPEAEFCDSFAALAFGHVRARRVVSERAERYYEFIRAECESRLARQAARAERP
jgi:hypothetical protein